MDTVESFAQSKARNDEGFSRWLAQPTTKLLISLIPPAAHEETLPTLLRDAFEAGVGQGLTVAIETMLDSMQRSKGRG